ncbi:MAG: PQQ-dependent sugar dehydrogenase [Verrucomicrobia bacterium]|nr:PQQ-dependent sugar dehydrogenase [Verrucomicrobiota bacterium]
MVEWIKGKHQPSWHRGARQTVVGVVALIVAASASAFTQRVANTSISLPAIPITTSSDFALQNAWPGVTFTRPVALASPPGETDRLFVLEQPGIISVITNLQFPSRQVFLDIQARVDESDNEEGLLGFAFHPGYATNGYFYVFYTGHAAPECPGDDNKNILSRFTVSATNPSLADANSEVLLLRQCDDQWNHNGGDLHFGPDGYLYVALGDEGSSNDGWDNSQQIDKDFFSAIARIDVDRQPQNLEPNWHAAVVTGATGTAHYKVPLDNPWVGATNFAGGSVNANNVRTEFYAVGLRNPWRFSFDLPTGRLYCGDVGQNAREEIDLIVKGGNYGWKLREGFIATPSVGGRSPGWQCGSHSGLPAQFRGHRGLFRHGWFCLSGESLPRPDRALHFRGLCQWQRLVAAGGQWRGHQLDQARR